MLHDGILYNFNRKYIKTQNTWRFTDFLSILICFAPSDFRSRPNIVLS